MLQRGINHHRLAGGGPAGYAGRERKDRPMRIAFLLYDQLTQLDMTGPAQVLSRMPGASVDYVAKTMDPVMSDCRLALVPTRTLAESAQFDLICVPGGYGCSAVMHDAEVLDWLRAQAPDCKWITSVCTGSLILAAAGLLEGRRAACHWAWGHYLPLFGAEYVPERTVFDENFKTQLAGKTLKVEGRIYPAEVLMRVGINQKGELRFHNFEVSVEHDAKKQNTVLGILMVMLIGEGCIRFLPQALPHIAHFLLQGSW